MYVYFNNTFYFIGAVLLLKNTLQLINANIWPFGCLFFSTVETFWSNMTA